MCSACNSPARPIFDPGGRRRGRAGVFAQFSAPARPYLAVLIPPFAVFALALLVLHLPAGRGIALSLSHGVLSFAAARLRSGASKSFAVGTVLNPVSEARAVYRLVEAEPQRTIEIHPRRTGGYRVDVARERFRVGGPARRPQRAAGLRCRTKPPPGYAP